MRYFDYALTPRFRRARRTLSLRDLSSMPSVQSVKPIIRELAACRIQVQRQDHILAKLGFGVRTISRHAAREPRIENIGDAVDIPRQTLAVTHRPAAMVAHPGPEFLLFAVWRAAKFSGAASFLRRHRAGRAACRAPGNADLVKSRVSPDSIGGPPSAFCCSELVEFVAPWPSLAIGFSSAFC